jgi:RimJ/RimL family protein N-acetyltransferase
MRFILAGKDELVTQWVTERIKDFSVSGKGHSAIGLMDGDGQILAGVVYDMFRGYDVQMHIATTKDRKWMTKTFLHECFRYPFLQLGVKRVTGLVPASNEDARRFDEHLGFKLEGRVRLGCPDGDDLLIYGMLKDECRWIRSGVH